jgi:CRISPR/Cas system-associated exonuclease Cas4 (RecB family)
MQKLREKSTKFNLYKDDKLLNFLKQILYNSKDKHIILEALYVLHILILTSKSEHDKSFIEYIHKEYFPLLKQQLEMREERFEYSLDRIQQIIQEIRELISD